MSEKRWTTERIAKALFAGVSSFGLTVFILLFLGVLTWRGTLDQQHMSLYDVKEKYFGSWFWGAEIIGGVVIPVPGAHMLLVLLAINLICGGLIRIRKRAATVGIIIGHLGILWMLSAGMVEYYFSTRGLLSLHEGEESQTFHSADEWEISIGQFLNEGRIKEHIVPWHQFEDLAEDGTATFGSKDLPFNLVVRRFHPNSRVVLAQEGSVGSIWTVDGFILQGLRRYRDDENRRNLGGAYIEVVEKKSGRRQPGILWTAIEDKPFTCHVDDRDWIVELRQQSFRMPFRIKLDRFTKYDHPGTNNPKEFSSDVTVFDGSFAQKVTISMNEPLRHKGYTVFQTQWGMSRQGIYSVFEIVSNPADQWPKWSCYVIAIGLIMHFSRKLLNYINAQTRGA